MRHFLFSLLFVTAITLGGWYGSFNVQRQLIQQPGEKEEGRQERPQKNGQEAQVDTETPTPTDTPTATSTLTVTPTPSSTPNLQYVSTLSSGRSVAVQYTISAGEALIALLEIVLIGLVAFGLFLALVNRR